MRRPERPLHQHARADRHALSIIEEKLCVCNVFTDGLRPPTLGIAAVGLVVNLVSMRLLSAGAQASLNVRGAYLEVLGDLLGSVAVLVAGAVIFFTGWTPIDPIASDVIALLILPRTWHLLREAVDVLLQATPKA